MAYCGPRGIPHSVFLGGPAGWTPDDRDKALAWQELDRQTCRGCGTRTEEWNPEHGGHRQAYDFDVVVCPGCEKKQHADAVMNSDEWKGQRGAQVRGRRQH